MRPRTVSFVLLLFIAGCSGAARLDDPYAGATTAYEPGMPTFDLEAQVRVEAGAGVVRAIAAVPYESLVFVQTGTHYEAAFDLSIRLRDRRGRDLLLERLRTDTVRVARYEETVQDRTLFLEDTLTAAPGRYVVEAVLTDVHSDVDVRRRVAVEVPDPAGTAPTLSTVALQGRRPGGSFEPLLAPVLSADFDSVQADVQLTRPEVIRGGEVRMRLLRFQRDTTFAQAPYWLSPSYGTLVYEGIDYHRADTLQQTRRLVPDATEALSFAFVFPSLDPGVYRVEIQVHDGDGEDRLRQRRDFLVTAPSFPRIETLAQMVEALPYIAYRREWEAIAASETPAAMKERFDAFWGSLIPNRQAAARLLEQYYARIEEANRRFTTYKEGWKTDRGMVYIVLGPPGYVQSYADREVWQYNLNEEDPLSMLVFERVPVLGSNGLFENYVLRRQPRYDYAWLRALERWRSGEVL